MKWHDILEMGNGVWAVTALCLTVFLTQHLVKVVFFRRPKRGLFDQPSSVQLAIGVYVVGIAILITRGIIWWARYLSGGPLLDLELRFTDLYSFGVALGIVGFLCIIRVVTRPVFGHWPWMLTLAAVGIYILFWAHKFM